MKRSAQLMVTASAAVIALAAQAQAADMSVPEIIEAPVYSAPEVVTEAKSGGWYLRGDIGYAANKFDAADYITYGAGVGGMGVLNGDVDASYTIGGGVGYQIRDYLRTDVTLDYLTKSDFNGSTDGLCTGVGADGIAGTADDVAGVACTSSDTSSFKAITLMANAYVDLGTFGRVTPYVGAGIGGAHVSWSALNNTIGAGFNQSGTVTHTGGKDWRFAYAVMAGASIDVNCRTAVDLGYRYQRIEGGKMFNYAEQTIAGVNFGTGPGYDRGIDSHQVRAGLRFKLGQGACGAKTAVYHPTPVPPVYK